MSRAIKIAIAGQERVGKTCLASYLTGRVPPDKYMHTIGADYLSHYLPEYDAKIHVWDLGGDERFSTISRGYMREPGVVIFMYDVTSPDSVERLKVIYKETKDVCDLDNKVVIVVANKSDLRTRLHEGIETAGAAFSASIDAPHITTSMKDATNVPKLIRVMMSNARIPRKLPPVEKKVKSTECAIL